MDTTGFSFFKHNDFNFHDSSVESEDDGKPPKPNSINISLAHTKVAQGGVIVGAVEVFVNQKQPEGKIILKLDSKLNVSFRDGSGKQIDELIIDCQ